MSSTYIQIRFQHYDDLCPAGSGRENVDVCKKLELNLLRFDRDMRVLSSKINIFKIFHFVLLRIKNIVDQRFQDFFQDFFYMVSDYTLILYVSQQSLGGIKKPPKAKI